MLRLMQIAVLAVALAVGASVAVADISGPLTFDPTGSWTISQGWYHNVSWDTYVLKLTGDEFDSPYAALSGYGSWALIGSSADTRIYKNTPGLGAGQNYYGIVNGTIYGAGTPSGSNKLELIAYSGTTWVGTDAYATNGAYLGCDELNTDGTIALWYGEGSHDYAAATQGVQLVPAPAALLLGMMGLGLVGWVKRRIA